MGRSCRIFGSRARPYPRCMKSRVAAARPQRVGHTELYETPAFRSSACCQVAHGQFSDPGGHRRAHLRSDGGRPLSGRPRAVANRSGHASGDDRDNCWKLVPDDVQMQGQRLKRGALRISEFSIDLRGRLVQLQHPGLPEID